MQGSTDIPETALYHALLEHTTDLVAVLDREGNFRYVSPSYERALGYRRADLLGTNSFAYVHPDDVRAVQAAFLGALKTEGMPVMVTFRYRDVGGTWHVIETIGINRLSDPVVAGFIVNGRDITEHQQMADERNLLMDRLSAVVQQLPVAVFIADAPSGRISVSNQKADELWRPAIAGDITIENYKEAYGARYPDGRLYASDEYPLARAITRGEVITEEEIYFRQPNENPGVALTSATPIRDTSGEIVAAVATLIDITDSRQLERLLMAERDRLQQVLNELATLQRTRDEFVSSISHDLKNPLTSLRGNVQLLHRQISLGRITPEGALERLESITAIIGAMTRLADDLVNVSHGMASHQLTLVQQPTDLVPLVRTFVERQRVLTSHRLKVETSLPELVVPADPALIERVLSNLVWNAIKYSPRLSRITVRLAQEETSDGPVAVLSVQDQGIGIRDEDLPRIFDRYYRGRNIDADVSGTGVGLASVQQIVTSHGGTVSVQSMEGKGSTFTVRLPIVGDRV